MTDPPTPVDRASPGTVVGGRYTLVAAVGHGGMGAVWRATDDHLGREVAVKEVAPPPGVSREERDGMYERMLREARAAASLSHPSVVQVYDVVTDGGRPWVVMELLDARSLADIVLSDGPLAPRAATKVGVALLGALEVAHSAGILHRDVKPANVLVCTDGRCVLTDFGVARLPTDAGLTTPGMVLGSPHFISPERALGASFGPPSDLFSLGVTLYTAVEGRPPFDKGDPIATMHSVVEDEPAPPQRAGPLAEVLAGLLVKDPQRRWDAARARGRLRELLAGPLASTSRPYPTDPMAVVPPQRAPQPLPYRTESRIGGRALLPPDSAPPNSAPPGSAPPGGAPPGGGGETGWPADPYRAMPDPYGQFPDAYQAEQPAEAYQQADAYQRADAYAQPSVPRQWAAPRQSAAPHSRGARPRGVRTHAGAVLARVAAAAGRVARRARQLPRGAQVAAAAGLVVAVTAGTVWAVSSTGGGDREPTVPGDASSPPPTSASPDREAPFPVQQVEELGMIVNLPEAWEEYDRTEIRVDYRDPEDHSSRLRLLREPSGADAMRFIEIIEPDLSCAEPYERVGDITEIALVGEPAALLEYRCGSGDDTRHSLWATVVRDGAAYSFFLSVEESEFEQRRPIFDELVASFQFDG